jgi:hypothetical protein
VYYLKKRGKEEFDGVLSSFEGLKKRPVDAGLNFKLFSFFDGVTANRTPNQDSSRKTRNNISAASHNLNNPVSNNTNKKNSACHPTRASKDLQPRKPTGNLTTRYVQHASPAVF